MSARTALALCLFGTATFLQPRTAVACSCLPPPPPLEAASGSDAVFIGEVVSIDTVASATNGLNEVRATFNVIASHKGAGDAVAVWTADNSAACGVHFEQGQRYLIYASDRDGRLSTNLCTRTARYEDASADIEALDLGVPERRGACGGPTNTGMLQAAIFTLMGLALAGRRSVR